MSSDNDERECFSILSLQAHVCVQQTVLDLIERDIEVHVIADACSSRSQMDRMFAYEVSHVSYTSSK